MNSPTRRHGTAPATGSVYALLRAQADRFADHDLLVLPPAVQQAWRLNRSRWTYAATLQQVEQLAARYRDSGYGPGHRVALLLENRPAHFLHWLALNAVGASMVPLNPDATASELEYVLAHSESVLVVATASRRAGIAPVADRLAIPVITGDADGSGGGDRCAEAIDIGGAATEHGAGEVGAELPPPVPGPNSASAGDPGGHECALLYTSGTTGRPKGCLLSNQYFLGWSDWYCAQRGLIALRGGQERLLTPLPTFHVNATGNSFMGMLASGGAQIIVDRFHPGTWWSTAAQTHATCFHYLGVMPAILLQLPASPHDRAHRLRFGMGGGVHPDHHQAFETRFGVPLLEGWAMTETGGGGILCAASEPRHVGERCVGHPDRPGPELETRLVDDQGKDVAPGEPGELWLRARGPNPRRRFFSGYLKDPGATEALWAEGWMHTGDIMRAQADGSLCFVDRKKNIIRRSGENIAAVEVEAAIGSHPAVHKTAVVAVLDPLRGEEVLAVVVCHDDAGPGEALAVALLEHCAARLAYYKLPGYVTFVAQLPTTSTQKVRKADLGELAANPASHPGTVDLRALKQGKRHATR